MSIIYSIIGFLIAIGVLVAVHEFGHMWVARKLGVKVLRYSIGFGKPLWKKRFGADNTEYVVAAVPLGGYVQMLGQGDNNVRPEERHRAFDYQPIWKRSLIVLAGPGINFLFAIVLFAILGAMSQQLLAPEFGEINPNSKLAKAGVKKGDKWLSIDGRPVKYFAQHQYYLLSQILSGKSIDLKFERDGVVDNATITTKDLPIYNFNPGSIMGTMGVVPNYPKPTTVIQSVAPKSPAMQAGIEAGDKITRVGQQPISRWSEFVAIVEKSANKELTIELVKGGASQTIKVTPEKKRRNGKTIGILGVRPSPENPLSMYYVDVDRSILESVKYGAISTWELSVVTVKGIFRMLSLKMSPKNVNGPITMADFSGKALQVGFSSYLMILAFISISLGVMNLLPIPMLDGGHLLMYAVEVVAGQNVAEKFFAVGQRVGIFLLLCLMSLAFYNDIFRLLN